MRLLNKALPVLLVAIGTGIIVCSGLLICGSVQDKANDSLYTGYTGAAKNTKQQNAATESPIRVDWEDLTDVNPEVVGWVYVEGDSKGDTISYPVLYREKDRDHYLRHDITGNFSKYGVPYIPGDYDIEGKVISIHGHNFGDSAKVMFSPLVKYENQEYAQRHPTIWYGKVGEQMQAYKVFSVVLYDCSKLDAGEPCWNYLQSQFATDEEYETWLIAAKEQSLFDTGVTPTVDDNILILSTCQTAAATNLRCVVMAVQDERWKRNEISGAEKKAGILLYQH